MKRKIKLLKVEIYLPAEALDSIRNAIKDYCIVNSEKYIHCMSWYKVESMWQPCENANPYRGKVGEDMCQEEYVLTFRCVREKIEEVVKLVKENHPYEEVAIDIYELW